MDHDPVEIQDVSPGGQPTPGGGGQGAGATLVASWEDLLFLAKPPGLPVFPSRKGDAGSVLESLLDLAPSQAQVPWPVGFEGGIAHRLDTETSGLLLVATSLPALERIREAFGGGTLLKTYLLVARRQVPWDAHEVEVPIGHDPRHKGRMVVQRGASTPHRGRWYPARTRFQREGTHRWRVTMSSGVMHQIRVHAAFVGLALLGDRLYGGGEGHPAMKAGFMLHHLGLEGPGWRTPQVPVPPWWGDVERSLGQGALQL